ncbi:hypothetical protein GCM10011359_23070 [Nesterenkonia alkaliphila]|nr:hypothetical protein GCM10011359_23070 [Nesterenkonia alkaliphila]
MLPVFTSIQACIEVFGIRPGEPGEADTRSGAILQQRCGNLVGERRGIDIDQRGDRLVQERPVVAGDEHWSSPGLKDGAEV